MSLDDIDVQVVFTSDVSDYSLDEYARETLRHRPLDRLGRHAMQEAAAKLLLPELERVAMTVIDSARFRLPAMPESTRLIESALLARLHELGMTDVFTVDVRLIDIRLLPAPEELEQFGFYKNESEQPT